MPRRRPGRSPRLRLRLLRLLLLAPAAGADFFAFSSYASGATQCAGSAATITYSTDGLGKCMPAGPGLWSRNECLNSSFVETWFCADKDCVSDPPPGNAPYSLTDVGCSLHAPPEGPQLTQCVKGSAWPPAAPPRSAGSFLVTSTFPSSQTCGGAPAEVVLQAQPLGWGACVPLTSSTSAQFSCSAAGVVSAVTFAFPAVDGCPAGAGTPRGALGCGALGLANTSLTCTGGSGGAGAPGSAGVAAASATLALAAVAAAAAALVQ